jgi:hypothetical protein
MRQWRVGSISMGVLLILLGIVLLLSQFNQWDYIAASLVWIPTVLIVLGLEIIIYLFLSKQEKPIVKYDIFSIFFICILGVFSMGMYLVSATGLLDAVEKSVSGEEVQGALPEITKELGENIEKVVIEPINSNITLEANSGNSLSVFGVFTSSLHSVDELTSEQVASIHQVDDTLYVQVFEAPRQTGIGYGYTNVNITVSVPGNVDVEVRSSISEANLALNHLQANWYLESVDYSRLSDVDSGNLVVEANMLHSIHTIEKSEEHADVDLEEEGMTKQFGSGQYKLKYGNVNKLFFQ